MILRRYGSHVHSVDLNFDSKALTEIGFRRDHGFSIPTSEFEERYGLVQSHEVTALSEGPVHDEAEQALLRDMESQVRALEAGLGEGEVLLVQSEQGVDYPKTRTEQKNLLVEGENRLYFYVRVEPPLRVGRYRQGA